MRDQLVHDRAATKRAADRQVVQLMSCLDWHTELDRLVIRTHPAGVALKCGQ
jgi:hypothetical protein